jgi:hypothetical protein
MTTRTTRARKGEITAPNVGSIRQMPDGGTAATDLLEAANNYCANMQAFFDLAECEVSEHNNSDFDNIEFLLKGAKAELFRFSKLVAGQEGGAA